MAYIAFELVDHNALYTATYLSISLPGANESDIVPKTVRIADSFCYRPDFAILDSV